MKWWGDGEVELMDLLVSEDKEALDLILDEEDNKYLLEALDRGLQIGKEK